MVNVCDVIPEVCLFRSAVLLSQNAQEPKWPNKAVLYIVYWRYVCSILEVCTQYTGGMYTVYWRYVCSILEVCM